MVTQVEYSTEIRDVLTMPKALTLIIAFLVITGAGAVCLNC